MHYTKKITKGEKIRNNIAVITGLIEDEFEYSHTAENGEKFYKNKVSVKREKSQEIDRVPIVVSQYLILELKASVVQKRVYVEGEVRSYNDKKEGMEGRKRLKVFVFVKEIYFITEEYNDSNSICFEESFLVKTAFLTKRKQNKNVISSADVLIAVNRLNGQSSYLPCIFWGANARSIARQKVGTRMKLAGKMQSREYPKKLPSGKIEYIETYEISVETVDVLE